MRNEIYAAASATASDAAAVRMRMLEEITDWIRERMPFHPAVAIVLGSGLGSLTDAMADKTVMPYEDIPGFPRTTVPGHEGSLVFGRLGGKTVVAMKGRFHYYEGNDMETCVAAIRIFKLLGIDNLLITNAAGGINLSFEPGTLMAITDHIGLFADSALRGINLDAFGPRFPDMSQVYDRSLVKLAVGRAEAAGIPLKTGVYAYCKGPMFETPAEIRALRVLGADAVGMSTVPETIVARHAGMRILGISCITNLAAGILDQPLSHEEVMETGNLVGKQFAALVTDIVAHWE